MFIWADWKETTVMLGCTTDQNKIFSLKSSNSQYKEIVFGILLLKNVCQCSIMSHLRRTDNPKLLPQTVDFWIDTCVLLDSNCVQICVLQLGFIVRYTDLPRGCVSWLIEWNRARYSVSDVTRGNILLMYPAVYLLTYLRGRMVLGWSNCTIPIINQVFHSWHWPHIHKY